MFYYGVQINNLPSAVLRTPVVNDCLKYLGHRWIPIDDVFIAVPGYVSLHTALVGAPIGLPNGSKAAVVALKNSVECRCGFVVPILSNVNKRKHYTSMNTQRLGQMTT